MPAIPAVDPGRGDDGALTTGVGVHRGADASNPRIGAPGGRFERDCDRNLVVDRGRLDAIVPGINVGGADAVGFGKPDPIIGLRERHVVAGLREERVDHVGIPRACVGEPFTPVTNHSDTDTAALGNGERLDVAVIDADLGAHRRTGTNLHLLAGLSSTHELSGKAPGFGISPITRPTW